MSAMMENRFGDIFRDLAAIPDPGPFTAPIAPRRPADFITALTERRRHIQTTPPTGNGGPTAS